MSKTNVETMYDPLNFFAKKGEPVTVLVEAAGNLPSKLGSKKNHKMEDAFDDLGIDWKTLADDEDVTEKGVFKKGEAKVAPYFQAAQGPNRVWLYRNGLIIKKIGGELSKNGDVDAI